MKETVEDTSPRICQIWGAGQYYGHEMASPDAAVIIAADGGADEAASRGVTPYLVVGDFDSIATSTSALVDLGGNKGDSAHSPGTPAPDESRPLSDDSSSPLRQSSSQSATTSSESPSQIRYQRLPAEKDDTDMLAAVKLGWEADCRVFRIYGGLGGRMDHTLANLNLISLVAAAGGRASLYGDGIIVTAISRGSLSFTPWQSGERAMVSVLSASDRSEGISERGLKYQVEGMTMTNLELTGVSNEFLPNTPARIGLDRGIIYVTYPDAAPMPSWHTDITPATSLGHLDTRPSRWLTRPGRGQVEKETNPTTSALQGGE